MVDDRPANDTVAAQRLSISLQERHGWRQGTPPFPNILCFELVQGLGGQWRLQHMFRETGSGVALERPMPRLRSFAQFSDAEVFLDRRLNRYNGPGHSCLCFFALVLCVRAN